MEYLSNYFKKIILLQLTDPSQHPCLFSLPSIFIEAMKGIAGLVDAFLGLRTHGSSQNKVDQKIQTGNTGRTSFLTGNSCQ